MSFQSKQESQGKRFLERLSANLNRKKPDPIDGLSKGFSGVHLITTQLSHQIATLLGFTFVIFEIIFLTCYATDFWFAADLSWFGLPAVIVSFVMAHFLLSWLESSAGCRFVSPIFKGRPPVVYRRWLSYGDLGIAFGLRLVTWSAIDGLALNFWGTLRIQSRALCGALSPQPDTVLSLPFGVISLPEQKAFIALAQKKNEKLLLGSRLIKRMDSHDPKFASLVNLIGPAIMLLVLLDVGISTFSFLEMEKNYYLAETRARAGNLEEARKYLVKADWQLTHPQIISLVNLKLLREGTIAAGVHQARAQALWYMGLPQEACIEAKQATTLAPRQYRNWLFLARMLADTGKEKQARACVEMAVDLHDESLLPRLYALALLARDRKSARDYYQTSLADLKENVFGDEPMWPPGGNRFLGDLFFTDDIRFVYDRLIAPPDKP